jgi:TPR repeat protein
MDHAPRCLLAAALLLLATPVLAGECRSQLRPLLLRSDPEPAVLAVVREVCEREAAAGDPDADYQLALLDLGAGGRWSPETAIPRVRSAAEAGVSEAQYWLAWQSEAGPLLPHDPEVALRWYRAAAASRHRLALERLAQAYETGGLGVTPDPQEVLRLRAEIRRCEDVRQEQAPR